MADLAVEIGVSEALFRRQITKVFGEAIKGAQDTQKKINDELSKIGDGFAGSEMTKAQWREFDKLKRQLDPVYAASKRYEAQLQQLNRAQQIGALSTKQYDTALQRLNAEFAGAPKAMDSVVRMGGQLQNIGFQVGDFATQVGAGTSATQALGQQLPQLLGGFGAFGAVAGAAAAIMIPLGAALFKAAGDSETLEERMDGLADSTQAMADAATRAATPLSELVAQYGDLADEIARANEAQAFFTAQLARRDLASAASRASQELFGGAFRSDRGTELQGQSAAEQRGLRIIKLANTLKVSADQARELFDGLNDLGKARGPEEVIKVTDRLMAILRDAPNATAAFEGDIAKLAALGEAAADQLAALQSGGEAIRQRNQQLLDTYDKTTQELVKLTEELDAAEKARAEASKERDRAEVARNDAAVDRLSKEVSAWDRVGAAIRERIKEVKELADEERKAAEDFVTRRAQAYQQYAATRMAGPAAALGDSMGPTREMLKQFEGWQPTGKLDVNAYRAGYGSSTVTLADGSIQKITAGMRVSVEDAERDLDRRILGYFEEQRRVSGSAFDMFTPEQKAALASIQHNYGSIPDRIKPALTTGDAQIIAQAIAGLAMDYTRTEPRDGTPINYNRRMKEAAVFGDVSVVADRNQEEIRALREQNAEREKMRKQAEDYGKTLASNLVTAQQQAQLDAQRAASMQAIEASGLEGPAKAAAIAEVNGEYEKQRLIFALIEDAKRRQVDLDTLMAGSTMTYAQAIAALGDAAKQAVVVDQQRKTAMEELAERQAFYNDLQGQMKNGLLDAIVAGESFADVLANVAQMLARAALQAALFNEGPFSGGSGGGLLGGLFKSMFGRASGGGVNANTPYRVGERGEEIFVPRSAGTIIPNHKLGGGGAAAEIIVRSEPGIVVEIARQEAVRVTQAGIGQYDRGMPSRSAQIRNDPLRR